MGATFYGFEIAKSGIYTSQTALNVTGHNIANVETPGYTRQRLEVAAVDPYGTLTRFAPVTQGVYGGGVETLKIVQIRNNFLDKQYRDEFSELNYWTAKADALSQVEKMFDITNGNEIQKAIESFMNSLSELQKDPGNIGVRTNVMTTGSSLAEAISKAYEKLVDQQKEQNEMIAENVSRVNTIADNIAILNDKIFKFEQSGDPANDLRDERNLLLDELSGLVDMTYAVDGDGKLSVYVDGKTLVSHRNTNKMEVVADAITGMYDIQWVSDDPAIDGLPVELKEGEIAGRMSIRDGNSTTDYGIPVLLEKLDNLAVALIEEFNKIHETGFSLAKPDGTTSAGNGISFFEGTDASSIKVSDDIINNPYLIAAGGTADALGDNTIALKLSQLFSAKDLATNSVGNFLDYLKGMMTELASQTEKVNTSANSAFITASAYDNQRMSTSGVSLDEEMTNLIKYQYAYSAAARVLTTMDEALDVLINRTGRVGL